MRENLRIATKISPSEKMECYAKEQCVFIVEQYLQFLFENLRFLSKITSRENYSFRISCVFRIFLLLYFSKSRKLDLAMDEWPRRSYIHFVFSDFVNSFED